jgi:hypothetical protein
MTEKLSKQEAATPSIPPFDDPQVQLVYRIICDDNYWPHDKREHWEGYVARHIVAAFAPSAKGAPSCDALFERVVYALDECWKGATEKPSRDSWDDGFLEGVKAVITCVRAAMAVSPDSANASSVDPTERPIEEPATAATPTPSVERDAPPFNVSELAQHLRTRLKEHHTDISSYVIHEALDDWLRKRAALSKVVAK